MLKKKSKLVLITAAVIFLLGNVFLLCYCFWKSRRVSVLIDTKIQNPKATVLFITSPENTYSFSLQEKGMRSVLLKNDVNIDIEFFKPDGFDPAERSEYLKKHVSFLNQKKRYDVVIASGAEAEHFTEEQYSGFFSGIPVIFLGAESNAHSQELSKRPGFYGFQKDNFLSQTISTARKLFPGSRQYVAVYDSSVPSSESREIFWSTAREFKGVHLLEIDASSVTREQLARSLASIEKGSIIFYLGAASDSSGTRYSAEDAADFIISSTDLPVFSSNTDGMGRGIVGGKMIDDENAGKQAARTALSILRNEDTSSIKLQKLDKGKFLFDYKMLEKHRISLSRLPKNSLVANLQGQTERIRAGIFTGVLGIFASLLFFIVILRIFVVSERKKSRELRRSNTKIRYLAEHDYITRLPNRAKVENVFNLIQKRGRPFSMVLFDIDNFKNINDIYSHSCGDEVLRTISARLMKLASEDEFFTFKFGGDEFLILYSNGELDENSPGVEHLKNIFGIPVAYNGRQITVQASFGIVNSRGEQLDTMIANADIALYRAKNSGRNKAVFFNEEMKSELQEADRILKILDDAIKNDGISVVYQPQVNADTGEIYGYEALMRLKDYKISPARFIPIAEESGRIIKIARILTEKVIRQMDEWRSHGIPLYKVSINYSYGQISDDTYVDFLEELLEQYAIPPELVCIEVTESLFVSNKDTVTQLLNKIVKKGITLALDDFGTGYSSLSYLTFLPIHVVKIDKSLVDNYLSGNRESFIKNIVRLVHSLEMKLTVEGVEHEWQNEKLRNFHCDYIQGYYYSKPISGREIEDFSKTFKGIQDKGNQERNSTK